MQKSPDSSEIIKNFINSSNQQTVSVSSSSESAGASASIAPQSNVTVVHQFSSLFQTVCIPPSVSYCQINSLVRELELNNQTQGAELLKLKSAIKVNSDEVAGQYRKIVELQTLIYELYTKLEERDGRIEGLNVEVNRITRLLANKSKEYDDLKSSYDLLIREGNNSQGTINQLNLTISGIQSENGRLTLRLKEIDEWRIKAGTFESALTSKTAEFEQKIICLRGEIDKANEKYNKRNQEYEKLTIKFDESLRRVSELENKNGSLLGEVQRYKDLLESKLQEYESLRLVLIEKEKIIESLNIQIVKIDKESKSTIFSLTKEIETKIGEIERLNQEITLHTATEAELKIRIEAYIKETNTLRENISRKDQEINQLKADFEAKIALLNTEYSKLQNILNTKLRDIESLNSEIKIKVALIQELEDRNRFLLAECEKWRFNYQTKLSEVEQWKLKYSSLETTYQDLKITNEEYNVTVEKLKGQLAKAREELLISQRKVTELTVQVKDLGNRIIELEGKIAMLASENLRITKLVSQKTYDLDAAKNEISAKLLIIAELEEKNKGLSGELDRISALLISKRTEIEEWKSKCGGLDDRIHDLEISIQTSREEHEHQKRSGQKNNDAIAVHLKKIAELNSLIHDLNIKLEDRDGRLSILTQENEKLNRSLLLKTKEYDEIKSNYERKAHEVDELNSSVNSLSVKIQAITNENGKLNGRLREIDEWKTKFVQLEHDIGSRGADFESKISTLKIEFEKANDKYNRKSKEYDSLKIKYDEYERLIGDYENRFQILSIEIDRSNGQLNIKKKEADDLRILLGQKEEIIVSLQVQIEKLSSEVKNRDLEFNKELERRKSEFSRLTQEFNENSSQLSQVTLRFENLTGEYNVLREKSSKYEKEILILTQRVSELERSLKECGDRLIEYENKIAILSSELARTKKMLENRQSNSEEFARQIRELEEARNSLIERIQEMEIVIDNSRNNQLYYLEVIVRLSCEVECLRVRTAGEIHE